MRYERYSRLVVGEHDADLVIEPVAGERCVLQTFGKLLVRVITDAVRWFKLKIDCMDNSLFWRTMPSHSAVTDVFKAPMSITRAVALLCEYLILVSTGSIPTCA